MNRDDALADFSSRGPAIADTGPKPELTAPGVGIVAARSSDSSLGAPGDAYVRLSGTSMATPHVAGAAALLAQQHPDWSGEQLKATLMAAAVRVPGIGVFGQGSGRVDVGRAVTQSITASPPSVAFGLQQWPHADDEPMTRTVTYHNNGSGPVELALTVQATGPTGQPAPAGMFTLAANRLTVPAGSTAHTTLTTSTRPDAPDAPDGNYGGYLVATAGDLVVNTPLSVGREIESYDLTLVHTDRDGAPATGVQPMLFRTDGTSAEIPVPASGRLRLPRGTYMVGTWIYKPDGDLTPLVQPRLELTRNQTVNLDARLAKPLKVTVPNPTASSISAGLIMGVPTEDKMGIALLTSADSFDHVYSAQLGPLGTQNGVWAKVGSQWARGGDAGPTDSPYGYRLAWYMRGSLPTGFVRNVRAEQLATVRASYASSTPGLRGRFYAIASAEDLPTGGFFDEVDFALPTTRTEYYNVDTGVTWENGFLEHSADDQHFVTSLWGMGRYQPGRTYRENWNRGVFGPAFFGHEAPDGEPKGVTRTDHTIRAFLSLYSDTTDRFALSQDAQYTSTLYRNEVLLGTADGWDSTFEVPTDEAGYRLRLDARRDAPSSLATRTSVEWTFRSAASPASRTRCRSRWRCALDGVPGDRAGGRLGGTHGVARSPAACRATRCASCRGLSLGFLPRNLPLALATFMPSRVRIRARSASNSATIANAVNNSLPTGSVGSCMHRATKV